MLWFVDSGQLHRSLKRSSAGRERIIRMSRTGIAGSRGCLCRPVVVPKAA